MHPPIYPPIHQEIITGYTIFPFFALVSEHLYAMFKQWCVYLCRLGQLLIILLLEMLQLAVGL